ncbi:hypothetical protein FHW16_002998 [Phyllobacterium myrsinacearum]|uniref:Uncharacterized protein n=1 Tax=Phyllobacterium myrsinacearum TaxID=28101 RepID=A0A839ERQ5_9HYPH|nr:hypothetical protein [Phyllobacterium myrsinacearum]
MLLTRCNHMAPSVLRMDAFLIPHRQIQALLVFAVPALRGILGWVTQLMNGGIDTFAELDKELNRSNPALPVQPTVSHRQTQSSERQDCFIDELNYSVRNKYHLV